MIHFFRGSPWRPRSYLNDVVASKRKCNKVTLLKCLYSVCFAFTLALGSCKSFLLFKLAICV